jgi:hypothetical protein
VRGFRRRKVEALTPPRLDALALLAEPLVEGGGIGDLAARLGHRLALLGGHQGGEILLVRHHQIVEFAQHLRPLLGGLAAPPGQCPVRRLDRLAASSAPILGTVPRVSPVAGLVTGIVPVDFDDTWPGPTTASDPAGGLSLRDLDRALAQIPEERREVILMIGLERISYEEAATILDVPIGTIRSRLSRGRESLRTLMDRRDGTEATSGAAITSVVPERRPFVPEAERIQYSHWLPA